MKNTNLIIIGVVVLLVLGGGYYFMSMNKSATPGTEIMENTSGTSGASTDTTPQQEATGATGAAMVEDTNAKVFTVTASNFTYDVKEIKVKKGDTVKIDFKNSEGMHDWNVDEFTAKTKVIKAGKEESVTFTADKTGTFEYYCSVGKHRQMGMVGNLIVEE